jgi:N-acetylmuramoyl-L-alanine amidase
MGFLAFLFSALLSLAPAPPPPPPALVAPTERPQRGELTVQLEPARKDGDIPLPTPKGPAGRPLVVLDPGHGGYDPGAHSPHSRTDEKDVTLALAKAVRDELVDSGRVRVALTREDDRHLVLRDRYEIARRLGAGLFISLHADAVAKADKAHGATIYTLSEVASGREAALLAREQNQSDFIGGVDLRRQEKEVTSILIDLTQRESMAASAQFANLLHREGRPFFPFRPIWHQFAAFAVLKAPDMPSILFESGYLTNPDDSAYIQSAEGRRQIATGMRRAIEAHFARRLVRMGRR